MVDSFCSGKLSHMKWKLSPIWRGNWNTVITSWPKLSSSICLDDLIPQVMFLHLNQFCSRAVFIVVRNTGIMCWGYSLSLSLRRPCLCNSTVSPRPRAVKHTLNHPRNPCSQQRTVAARCYNLNLYFVSDCDDLTEKNKRICLDLQLSLEEVSLHLEV